jgi:hypothetical protein
VLRITSARASRIRQRVGPRAVDTFAGPKRHAWTKRREGYSQPLLVDVRVRHRPTKARPSRVAPTSYTVPFPTLAPNPQHTPNKFPIRLPIQRLITPPLRADKKKNAPKTRARGVPPCLLFSDTNPSSKCDRFSGRQGLLFLFDLAGSLALKIDWRINVSEATYGKEACGTMRHSSKCRPETTKLRGVILEVQFLGRNEKDKTKKNSRVKWRTKKTACYCVLTSQCRHFS